MHWIADTLRAFGETIGLPDLALDDDSSVTLALESGDQLAMQYVADAVGAQMVVTHSRAVYGDPARMLEPVLRLADFRRGLPWSLQAGLQEGRLLLGVRLPERAFSLTTLLEALAALRQFQDRLVEAR